MLRSRAIVAVGAVALGGMLSAAGCRFDRSGFADDGSDGDGPADAAVSDDGSLLCDPATMQICLDPMTAQTCGPSGPEKTTCELGCSGGAGEAHCRALTPSNGVKLEWLDETTAELDVNGGLRYVFDTDTGRIDNCTGDDIRGPGTGLINGIRFEVIPARGDAPAIGVWSFARFEVRMSGDVHIVGERAAAWLLSGDAIIDKQLSVAGGSFKCTVNTGCFGNGTFDCGGPGATDGGAPGLAGGGVGGGMGGAGSSDLGLPELGGGGGGYGDVGGQGGGGGGSGGLTYGLSSLDPLFAGCGGGGGGSGTAPGGLGGGGGGALQITALGKIHVKNNGVINAGGAGGRPGIGGDGSGGGGGGAGGGILLEAPILDLDGAVAANGGGGGGANASGGSFGETAGVSGTATASPASGGSGFYLGGAGGAQADPAGQDGEPITPNVDGTGGGGGAAGRIHLRTVDGGLMRAGGAVVSPQPTVSLDLIR